MRRVRLRPAWSDVELAMMCADTHDYRNWTDHSLRVPLTAELCRWVVNENQLKSAADLACGEGYMLTHCGAEKLTFGDVTYGNAICGPIEKTIDKVGDHDLLICTEVLEHMDDPETFLKKARQKFRFLVASTPIGSFWDDTPGHYWAWDREAVEDMIESCGWEIETVQTLAFTEPSLPHTFGIWSAV